MKKKIVTYFVILTTLLLAGCANLDKNKQSESSNISPVSTEHFNVKDTDPNLQALPENITVTLNDAIIQFKNTYPTATIILIDLASFESTYCYEISSMDNNITYRCIINAQTGELQENHKDISTLQNGNITQSTNETLDLNNIISLDEATEIAVRKLGTGQAIEWVVNKELSTTFIEVIVRDGNLNKSVKVDSQTGEILDVSIGN